MNKMNKFGKLLIEIVSLRSPRARLLFFALVSVLIYVMPAKWPVTLSVWQNLGIPSPSIGLTRAYRFLLHGDPQRAWQQNRLIFVIVAVGGIILVRDAAEIIRKHKN